MGGSYWKQARIYSDIFHAMSTLIFFSVLIIATATPCYEEKEQDSTWTFISNYVHLCGESFTGAEEAGVLEFQE